MIGQLHFNDTARAIGSIRKLDGAAVGFSNLLREYQPNAGAAGLGSVEGHESIAGIEQTDAVVLELSV